jgi:hypothetical protein
MIGRTVVALLLVAAMANVIAGQIRPDLNGTWKLNPSKSKFTSGEVPANLAITFESRGTILRETLTIKRSGFESTTSYNYDLNGKETVNRIDDDQITTTARWDRDALVLEWRDQGGIFTRRFVFDNDARSMTMEARDSDRESPGVDRVVLEKQ